jgi:hypothetical protein
MFIEVTSMYYESPINININYIVSYRDGEIAITDNTFRVKENADEITALINDEKPHVVDEDLKVVFNILENFIDKDEITKLAAIAEYCDESLKEKKI